MQGHPTQTKGRKSLIERRKVTVVNILKTTWKEEIVQQQRVVYVILIRLILRFVTNFLNLFKIERIYTVFI